MDSIVSKAGVALDTRLLGQDVIVLPLEVADDFCKAAQKKKKNGQKRGQMGGLTGCLSCWLCVQAYLASLSIWSPNPGVSTMVKEMRVPSSSSSSSDLSRQPDVNIREPQAPSRTNSDGLDLDAILDVNIGGIVRVLVLEDIFATERVDKCSTAYCTVAAVSNRLDS